MSDTYTPNLNLTKPAVGASRDTWGTKTNGDWDLVDAVFAGAGTGTSVGLNVGSGKTLSVAGTLTASGTVTLPAAATAGGATIVSTTGTQTLTNKTLTSPEIGGQASYAAGTVSAPSITFTGDTNTGIYSPAADTIAFTEGGVEAMRLDASGNVGIGLSNPTFKLQMYSSGAATFVGARVQNDVVATDQSVGNGFSRVWNATNHPMVFGTNNTECMRIDASGNVGIGTSSPSATLDVRNPSGNCVISAQFGTGTKGELIAASNQVDIKAYNGTNDVLTFTTGASERARIDTSGNVGIGTSSPTHRLDVRGGSVIAGSGGVQGKYLARNSGDVTVMDFGIGTGTGFGDSIGLYNLTSSGLIAFGTNNTERLRIDNSGNVTVAKSTTADTTVGSAMLTNGRVTSTMASSTSSESAYHLYSTGAGAYRFYVSLAGVVFATSTTINGISDQRLKENVRDLDAGLAEVMALKPRRFDWKPGKGKDKKDDQGWIAQEFEQVFPDMVTEWKDPAPEGEEPYKAVSADLLPVLVKAIQQQQAQIEELKARVAALENK